MAANLNIAEYLENKTILITGATGFLGKSKLHHACMMHDAYADIINQSI